MIDPSAVSSSESDMDASPTPSPAKESPLAVTLAPVLVRDLLPLLENLSDAPEEKKETPSARGQ